MSEEQRHAYVGRAPCGCLRMLVVEDLRAIVDSAEEIRELWDAGVRFERMTVEKARRVTWDCEKHDAAA